MQWLQLNKVGSNSQDSEKVAAMGVAAKYVETASSTDGRDADTPIMIIRAGSEVRNSFHFSFRGLSVSITNLPNAFILFILQQSLRMKAKNIKIFCS